MALVAFRSPNWIGDAVLSTVVLPALRRGGEAERLEVVAPRGLGDLFRRSPHVDRVVEFERGDEVGAYRSGGYDLVLLGPTSFGSAWRARRGGVPACGFATGGRGLLLRRRLPGAGYRRDRHQVENYRELASLLGSPSDDDVPAVELDEAWRREARARWPSSGAPRVALQPGAAYGPAKRWSPERFAELAAELLAARCDVGVLGGPADRGVVAAVLARAPRSARDLSGPSALGPLAAVLESADLLVTNDTGPMHLAAAVGTRCLALFGSTSPTWTGPWGAGHRTLRHPVPCAPCFRRRCRIGTLCLEGIGTARVAAEVRALLWGNG